MKWLMLVAGLMLATSVQAAERGLVRQFSDHFSLTAGVRWDSELVMKKRYHITSEVEDQFFVGGAVEYPLARWAELGGNFDRDFVEGPDFSARLYLSIHPWREY